MKTPSHTLLVASVVAFAVGCGGGSTASTSATAPTATALQATRSLATNDVSVLFPLGKGDLWSATTPARGGTTLFPRSAFDLITLPVIRELQGPNATYNGLRVVSMRFDPCFGGTPCYPQIRLVFQGLNDAGTSAFDGAIHALYNLSADEFQAMTVRLKAVASLAPENAAVTRLEVSPSLLAQGMSGAYGVALRDVVTQTIGGAQLAKVTFMTRAQGGGARWDFGGFNLRDFQPAGGFGIAGLDGNVLVQTVRENGGRGGGGGQGPGGAGGYAYTVAPGTLHGQLNAVLSSGAALAATASERQAAMDALARVENPLVESPDTVDCGACHVANRIRGGLQATFSLSSALAYASTAEATRLIGGAERDNDNLRAFGYFDAQPAIAQRTANETLKVLAAMR
jgi:hypothetical protein